MDKEIVGHIHNGILLNYKNDAYESVLMRWMKLESIIQNEVSQKENTDVEYQHIYMELRKMVMTILYSNLKRDADVKNRLLDSVREGEGKMI